MTTGDKTDVFLLHRADAVAASQGQSGILGTQAGMQESLRKLGGGRKDGPEAVSKMAHPLSHLFSGILVALC